MKYKVRVEIRAVRDSEKEGLDNSEGACSWYAMLEQYQGFEKTEW